MAKAWEKVLDGLYNLGGYGMWTASDEEIDSGADLVEETGLSPGTLDDAVSTLGDRGNLLEYNMTVAEDGASRVTRAQLTSDGFSLAHDRTESKRNRVANQSVAFLTLVLALVGLGQAIALSVQANAMAGTLVPLVVTGAAAVILFLVFRSFYKEGVLDIDDLG